MRKLVPALSVVALAATACVGGGGGTGTVSPQAGSSSPDARQVAALFRQATECARKNGMPNLPYPTQDPSSGEWNWPEDTPEPPQSVRQGCKSLVERIEALDQEEEEEDPPTAAEMAKLKQWAKCLRDNGLPYWPDPNPDGTFTMPEGQLPKGKPQQFQTCKRYDTGRDIRIVREGSDG